MSSVKAGSITKHEQIIALFEQGKSIAEIILLTGFSAGTVHSAVYRHKLAKGTGTPPPGTVPTPAAVTAGNQEVTEKREGDTTEITAKGTRIRTVEDLFAYHEVDTERFEIAAQEVSMYETTVNTDDGPRQLQNHRVWVRLKPKAAASKVADTITATVERRLDAINGGKAAAWTHRPSLVIPGYGILQVIPIADPHFGKYASGRYTGDRDWSLEIADAQVRGAAFELIERGDDRNVEHRLISLLGDIYQYDTLSGTTTAGTNVDRDSRAEKMLEVALDAILDVIERAATVPTTVICEPGNHDAILGLSLRTVLRRTFRNHPRVSVSEQRSPRSRFVWGATGLCFTHGHQGLQRIASALPFEWRDVWSQLKYVEVHTGHLHTRKADRPKALDEFSGVLCRVAPALCPPDQWHAEQAYVGNLLAMEAFYYHRAGKLLGHDVASPDYPDRIPQGAAA